MPRHRQYNNPNRQYGNISPSLQSNLPSIKPLPHAQDIKSYNRFLTIQCKSCLQFLPNTEQNFYSSYNKASKKFLTGRFCIPCTKASVTKYRKARSLANLSTLTPQIQLQQETLSPLLIPSLTTPHQYQHIFRPSPDQQQNQLTQLVAIAPRLNKHYLSSILSSHTSPMLMPTMPTSTHAILEDPIVSPIISLHSDNAPSATQTTKEAQDDTSYWPFILHFAQVLQAAYKLHPHIAAYIFQANSHTHIPAQIISEIHQQFINTNIVYKAIYQSSNALISHEIKKSLELLFFQHPIPNFNQYADESNPSLLAPYIQLYLQYLQVFQQCIPQAKLQTLIRYKTCLACKQTLPTYFGSFYLRYVKALYMHTSKRTKSRFNHQQTLPTFPAYFQKSKMANSGWQQYCIFCRSSADFQTKNHRYNKRKLSITQTITTIYNPLTLPLEIQFLLLPIWPSFQESITNAPNIILRPYRAQSPYIYQNYAKRFSLYNLKVRKFHFQLLYEFIAEKYQTDSNNPLSRDKAAIYRNPPTPQAITAFHNIQLPLIDPEQWSMSKILSSEDRIQLSALLKKPTKHNKRKSSKKSKLDPDQNFDHSNPPPNELLEPEPIDLTSDFTFLDL